MIVITDCMYSHLHEYSGIWTLLLLAGHYYKSLLLLAGHYYKSLLLLAKHYYKSVLLLTGHYYCKNETE